MPEKFPEEICLLVQKFNAARADVDCSEEEDRLLARAFMEAKAEGAREEREACALLVRAWEKQMTQGELLCYAFKNVATAILARGNAP